MRKIDAIRGLVKDQSGFRKLRLESAHCGAAVCAARSTPSFGISPSARLWDCCD